MANDCSDCVEIRLINQRIDNIVDNQKDREEAIEKRFDKMDERFDLLGNKIDKMNWWLIGTLASIVLIFITAVVVLK